MSLPLIMIIVGSSALIAWELSFLYSYGWFLNDKEWLDIIHKNSTMFPIDVNRDEINIGILPPIKAISGSIFCRYSIGEQGTIRRGSKCHKLIKKYFYEGYKTNT